MSTFFLGIAGGSASGKSWLTQHILEELGVRTAAHVAHDNYYKPLTGPHKADPSAYNFDHPDALETALLVEHLRELRAGRAVEMPDYCFTTHSRIGSRKVDPCEVVVIEGILLFTHPALRDLLDLRVFVEAPTDVRRTRRVKRDIEERGRQPAWVIERFAHHVEPMHQQYVEPTRRHAHLVVDGQHAVHDNARRVLRHIRDKLR